MKIKSILDEIANEPGSNAKMDILRKYKGMKDYAKFESESNQIKGQKNFDMTKKSSIDFGSVENSYMLENNYRIQNEQYIQLNRSQKVSSIFNKNKYGTGKSQKTYIANKKDLKCIFLSLKNSARQLNFNELKGP